MIKAQYNAIVENVREITDEIRVFSIVPEKGRFVYKAGQFAVLGLPLDSKKPDGEWIARAYSIASGPSEDTVKFYIVLVSDGREDTSKDRTAEDGRLTSRLFALKSGDRIFMGPKASGIMGFENVSDDSDVLFISTGTGIAPFSSIIHEHMDTLLNGRRQVGLVHGSRHVHELGFKPEMEEIAAASPYFHYLPVVSRSDGDPMAWSGYKGHVQDLISDGTIEKVFGKKVTARDFTAFVCGNPRMVDETVEMLSAMGFVRATASEPGNLYYDKH
jgi:ferredoxin--NADP+ reductase